MSYEKHIEVFKTIVDNNYNLKNEIKDVFGMICDYLEPDKKELYECAKNITFEYLSSVINIDMLGKVYDDYVNEVYKILIENIGCDYNQIFINFYEDPDEKYYTNSDLNNCEFLNDELLNNECYVYWGENIADLMFEKIGFKSNKFNNCNNYNNCNNCNRNFHVINFNENFNQKILKHVLVFFNTVLSKRKIMETFDSEWNLPYFHDMASKTFKTKNDKTLAQLKYENDKNQFKKLTMLIINRALYVCEITKPPDDIFFNDMDFVDYNDENSDENSDEDNDSDKDNNSDENNDNDKDNNSNGDKNSNDKNNNEDDSDEDNNSNCDKNADNDSDNK